MILYKDPKYNFVEIFNPNNGFLIRFDDNTGQEPFMRAFPELLDIGIMGFCDNHLICKSIGIDCYQYNSTISKRNMVLSDYLKIMNQCKDKVFQVALGGWGDPNKHPEFELILQNTYEHYIVPNLTTSGRNLSDKEIKHIKKYCGAVAVSFYSRLDNALNETNPETLASIDRLICAGSTVNIHYVLSTETVKEAVFRLENDLFPQVNAIIFILYKPVGLGKKNHQISLENETFAHLLEIIDSKEFQYKIGFDTCHTPAIVKKTKQILFNSIDACEASRFSMYIDSELNAFPCSFDCSSKAYMLSLRNSTIDEVWNSVVFDKFRSKQKKSCSSCSEQSICMGGCQLDIGLDVCNEKIL